MKKVRIDELLTRVTYYQLGIAKALAENPGDPWTAIQPVLSEFRSWCEAQGLPIDFDVEGMPAISTPFTPS